MKKSLRILVALSIAASSLVALQPASAGPVPTFGTPYNGTSGDVACSTGFFEILNNVVIENNANDSCTGSVVIPLGVTSVAGYAFNLLPVTSVSIPESVTTIGSAAFYTGALTSLTIPNSVISIGVEAFAIWSSLSSYEYCGTTLTSSTLTLAGLGSKRKTCTPLITAPGSPVSVVAITTGKRSATVSFGAPASNGGSAVISYTATSTPGGFTQTFIQATGGTFNFDGLKPSTAYSFAVTAKNAIGTSQPTYSNTINTDALVVASLSELTFVDDGDGESGKIVWAGVNIDSVLYKGPEMLYPGPFKFDAVTSGWNGRLRNLIPNTTYDISIGAFSADGVGGEKSLTFTTNAAPPLTQTVFDYTTGKSITTPLPILTDEEKLAKLLKWVNENTYVTGEASNMSGRLTSFAALETSPHSSTIRVPLSSVSTVVETSLTPLTCSVNSATAAVEPGLITALSGEKCTISYTVSGGSNAPATLIRDFYFKTYVSLPVKFACGAGFYTIKAGAVSAGRSCTGAVTIDSSATSIAPEAFVFSSITSITLPNSVTNIGDAAFFYSFALKKVELGNAVTRIGNDAFANTNFSSIVLPTSLRTIGIGSFRESGLTSVIIPVGTTTVGFMAFVISRSLTTVTVPSTITSMDQLAFIYSGVKTVNYCGNNSSVLDAIKGIELSPTCVAPATSP